ncbi:MAG: hypothetical protein CMH83_02065 [Nocardioides sp.]|nr:hypothetical protein [Nocardioides sp.]
MTAPVTTAAPGDGAVPEAEQTSTTVLAAWSRPLPLALTVAVLGLAVQTVGYLYGWAGDQTAAVTGWYVGLVLVVAPWAALLLSTRASRTERFGGALGATLTTYVSWLLASPVVATATDETLHVATLAGLTDDGVLTNSVLPVSPHYPGLELVAGGVHWLTGLPLMAAQVVVVLLSRVLLTLALFLLAERVSGSAYAAGLVVLLYTASPQWYFFNAQFSYQTLALALAVAVLWLVARTCDAPAEGARAVVVRRAAAAQAVVALLVVTHHLSSWVLLGGLWLLAALVAAGRDRVRAGRVLLAAELGTLQALLWSLLVAPLLQRYLGPVVDEAATELGDLLLLDLGRTVGSGSGSTGTPTPWWELVVMGVSVLLWLVVLVPGARAGLAARTLPRSTGRLLPVWLAATYPLLIAARFSPTALEVADRASTYVFLAMALVAGTWLARWLPTLRDRPRRRVVPALVAAVVVAVVGGAVLGSGPDWQRVPGPYLAGAQQRSVDAQTIAVADWAAEYLPEGSRVAADTTFSRVLPTVAPVEAVTDAAGSVNVTDLFESSDIETANGLVGEGDIDFVVVDTRTIDAPLLSGTWFEGSDAGDADAATLTAEELGKFEGADGWTLVLDGPVQVYDVRDLRGEPTTYVDRGGPGLPGTWHPFQLLVVAGLALLGGALLPLLRRRAPRTKVRDGGAHRGDGSRTTLLLALALPALALVGAAPLVGAGSAVRGTVAAAVVVVVGTVVLGRRPRPSRPQQGRPRTAVPWVVIASLLVTLLVVAGWASWKDLYDVASLPAPAGLGGAA